MEDRVLERVRQRAQVAQLNDLRTTQRPMQARKAKQGVDCEGVGTANYGQQRCKKVRHMENNSLKGEEKKVLNLEAGPNTPQ